MTQSKPLSERIGVFEATALVVFGVALALVFVGRLDAIALVILLVWVYIVYLARGMVQQAQRFRPVEPPGVWWITLVGNIVLMVIGLVSFGWYLLGGGALAWVPLLVFIAGMVALRQWRQGVAGRVYAWREPALILLQRGEYKKLARELEADPALDENPDKLATLALAYIELNKWQRADEVLTQARQLAPNFASVNGAIGSLRRHQARYEDAVTAIRKAIAFEENISSRYYLGLCQFLAGDADSAGRTLRAIMDEPDLLAQGQVMGAYILGQVAEQHGDREEARRWYDRMAERAPRVIPHLQEEARRHKQTPYGDTLKEHVRTMQQIIARRPISTPDNETS